MPIMMLFCKAKAAANTGQFKDTVDDQFHLFLQWFLKLFAAKYHIFTIRQKSWNGSLGRRDGFWPYSKNMIFSSEKF
jgi:hypothetical protein